MSKRNIDPDLKKLARLLAELQRTDNALEKLNAKANGRLQKITDKFGANLLALEEANAAVERELHALVAMHPEWFPANRRTKETPHGAAQARASKSVVLEVSEDEVMRRIVKEIEAVSPAEAATPFRFDDLVKTTRELRREQLALLPPELLARLGLRIEEKDTFTFKPKKLKLKAKPIAADKNLSMAA